MVLWPVGLARRQPDQPAVGSIGDRPERTVGSLRDMPETLVLILQQPLLADDAVAVDHQSCQMLPGQRGDEQVVLFHSGIRSPE